MVPEIRSQLLRQVRNVSLFRAFTAGDLVRNCLTFPFDYYLRAGRSAPPLSISLCLTLRCNLRCGPCNMTGFMDDPAFRDEMSLESIREVARDLARSTRNVVLSGGEPFARKDLVEIVRALRGLGMRVGLFTNGLLAGDEKVDALSDLDLSFVAFSLEGPEAVHDRVVGLPGAFSRITRTIRRWSGRRRRTRLILHPTISETNLDHLEEVVEIGRELGVDGVRFGHLSFLTPEEVASSSEGEGIGASCLTAPGMPDPGAIGRRIASLRRRFPETSFCPELSDEEIPGWYAGEFRSSRACHFLWRNVFVFPNADVYPCVNLRSPMGNLRVKSFAEIWNGAEYVGLRRRVKKALLPACHRCCKL